MKKISFIIPTWNREHCIMRAIESVMKQNPYEVIVVDDGGTDSTDELITAYNQTHKKQIKYIYSPINKGPHSARNLGLRYSTGDWVIMFDNDNELMSGALKVISQEKLGLINLFHTVSEFGKLESWNHTGKEILTFKEWITTDKIGGEFLIVYDRRVMERNLFPEDRSAFEWHHFNTTVKRVGGLHVFDWIIHKYYYDQHGNNCRSGQLKSLKNIVKRLGQYWKYYKEFKAYYPLNRVARMAWRVLMDKPARSCPKKTGIIGRVRKFYGTWLMRVGELGSITSMAVTGFTASWAMQSVLEKSYNIHVSIILIMLAGGLVFCTGAFLLDRLGLIGSKEEAMWERNKYSNSLTEEKNGRKKT